MRAHRWCRAKRNYGRSGLDSRGLSRLKFCWNLKQRSPSQKPVRVQALFNGDHGADLLRRVLILQIAAFSLAQAMLGGDSSAHLDSFLGEVIKQAYADVEFVLICRQQV